MMPSVKWFDTQERRLLVILAAMFLVALVFVLTLLVANRNSAVAFSPPPFEENLADVIPDNLPKEIGYRKFEIDEGFTVSLCGIIETSDNRAWVYFSSDEENKVWTRIVLLDSHGKLLGESGILLPGQAITDIALKEQPAETMDITVKVLSYEPETYYSHGSAEILGTLIV